ncbi:ADP-ribose pyrophosphatase YjhB (NUDIX family) [Kocuria rhizophila]|uniref:Nudix hydrolase domain-containing protein n=1 Tax=Kocuria rhizophila (strain ATCC 9341 / DSM 348 / NBRC 103217 / DC2201) TaxID=378753 RepID=B2GFX9_KOCRD|nr:MULTISPECIES: NUDIX hydrolase [Kocuria]ASE10683.1 NUDIX hydrolase [Kocuria rhizophila]MBK4119655.1 NUDIX hydrolase [Kocuria rhizophila]MCC5671826.1 NUDIX hydrolase [Kocuria rhizophila]MCC5673904.1 NUDIX hydrolase [Kocuria rhizophila]WTI33102.1 NUDIX hydrolase [Kocuria rhizophila]
MGSYLPDDELREFIATLPTRRLASAAVIRDENGRVLAVEPNYKDGWTLPGGTVEAGEDPRTGCFREVVEEVGLHLPEGRLIAVTHGVSMGMWGDSVSFLYDGGRVPSDTPITVQEEELLSYRWVAPEDLETVMSPGMAAHLRAAIEALESGTVVERVMDGGSRS